MKAGDVIYQVEADVKEESWVGIWVILPFGEQDSLDGAKAVASIQLEYARLDGKEFSNVRMVQATVSAVSTLEGL